MINRATGQIVQKEFNYKQERQLLLRMEVIQKMIPSFIKSCRSLEDFWWYIKNEYPTYQERRIYIKEEFSGLLVWLESKEFQGNVISDRIEIPLGSESKLAYIDATWNKAIRRVSDDPEGAITIARTLLEEILKYILVDTETSFRENEKLPILYREVRNLLNLSPEQHTEEIFKQILGGCNSVVVGLGSLRSKHGDAHGDIPNAVKPSKRHAKLAVNLAGAMGEFIMATYLEREF